MTWVIVCLDDSDPNHGQVAAVLRAAAAARTTTGTRASPDRVRLTRAQQDLIALGRAHDWDFLAMAAATNRTRGAIRVACHYLYRAFGVQSKADLITVLALVTASQEAQEGD